MHIKTLLPCAIMLGLFGCGSPPAPAGAPSASSGGPPRPAPAEAPAQGVAVVERGFSRRVPSKSDPKQTCSFDVKYPQVNGLPDAAVQRAINEALADSVPKENRLECDERSETAVTYPVSLNEAPVLSVRISRSDMAASQPHASLTTKEVNVRTDTGAPLKLFGDVLRPGTQSALKALIAPKVGRYLKEVRSDATVQDVMTLFEPPESFGFKKGGLRLYVNDPPSPYAVFSDLAVDLSYKELASLLAEGGATELLHIPRDAK